MTLETLTKMAETLGSTDAKNGRPAPRGADGVLWTIAKRARRAGFHVDDEDAILLAYCNGYTNGRARMAAFVLAAAANGLEV